MKFLQWLHNVWKALTTWPLGTRGGRSVREFVYLDEVSLTSLLSSISPGLKDTISEGEERVRTTEDTTTLGFSVPGGPKVDGKSRFQTANSSSIHTSRKSTVQTWFGELHENDDLFLLKARYRDRIRDRRVEQPLASERAPEAHETVLAERFERGELIELRVKLSADPILHFDTIMREVAQMMGENPRLFGVDPSVLEQASILNELLERLLTGLVPIRAQVRDYVVAIEDGAEVLVPRASELASDTETRELQVVGVTELDAYWRDIRRVLFSDAEYTMLCRVARTGLQEDWTPVKLADLLKPLEPNLADQLNSLSLDLFHRGSKSADADEPPAFANILRRYAERYLARVSDEAEGDDFARLDEDDIDRRDLIHKITVIAQGAKDLDSEHGCFARVRVELERLTGRSVDGDEDLAMRKEARLLVAKEQSPKQSLMQRNATKPLEARRPSPRLLDVEVVAIYW